MAKKIKHSDEENKNPAHEAAWQRQEVESRASADHGTACFRLLGAGTCPVYGTGPALYCVPVATLRSPGRKLKSQAEWLAIRASMCLHKWHWKYKSKRRRGRAGEEALEELTSAAVRHNRLGWTIKCILNPTPPKCSCVEVFLYKCTRVCEFL